MLNSKFQKYDLNRKVDVFIEEYDRALREAKRVTDVGEFHFPRDLRNYIEAKAVYAELRWPHVYHDLGRGDVQRKNEEARRVFTWTRFRESILFKFYEFDFNFNLPVLHRIIERGSNRIGPRRGVLFAQEHGLDVNVPIAYSIDLSDASLFQFLAIHESKLNREMVCPMHYFSRTSDSYKEVDERKLGDIFDDLQASFIERQAA